MVTNPDYCSAPLQDEAMDNLYPGMLVGTEISGNIKQCNGHVLYEKSGLRVYPLTVDHHHQKSGKHVILVT